MIHLIRCAAVSAALFLCGAAASAQDVELTSRDGTLSLSGDLQSYDGEFYRVMTEYGLLTLDGQGVVCAGPACPDLTAHVAEVHVAGDPGAGTRLMPALVAAFAATKGYGAQWQSQGDGWIYTLTDASGARAVARFSFVPMAADAAAAALRDGVADFVLAALPEPGMGARVLGVEALVVVVAPGNPLAAISTGDLARVLSGQVENWNALGGPDMPLVVHALAPEAGFRRALEARLGQKLVSDQDHATLDDLAAAVARDPWGLAVTAASATGPAQRITLTDSCGFALVPSRLSVKAGDYPLTQPFNLLTPKRRQSLMARDFLDFVGTPAAQAAVSQGGMVDRAAERGPLLTDGLRLANAIRSAGPEVPVTELQRLTGAMAGADRLSLTFRFQGGARVLDASSQDNVAELARLIGAGLFDGEELVFAGFSDGSGDAATNLALSRQRADTVREAVAAAVPDLDARRFSLSVEAFGEVLPMACDESPVGRQLNRRVELWLRPQSTAPAP